RALGYFDGSDLPFYWDLYSTLAMSDHHHCSVLGGTYPNRWYFLSATSFGMITNDFIPEDRFDQEPFVIMQELDDAGVDWHVYTTLPFMITYSTYIGSVGSKVTYNVDQFFEDLDAGTLATVVWIDPAFSGTIGEETDEHPPAVPQVGEAGDRPPDVTVDDAPGDFDRLGFRVPLVIVSPYSKPGYVSKQTTDATSVLRLIETRFDLPALTGRDANAWPLLDMFDFDDPSFMEPPELASAVLPEQSIIDACEAAFPSPPPQGSRCPVEHGGSSTRIRAAPDVACIAMRVRL
ncbi:MAG: hypothetical protein OEV36_11300, partial [Myxococcales bacterium]|nr:hypothetical protein [Myxococcales bacterium]